MKTASCQLRSSESPVTIAIGINNALLASCSFKLFVNSTEKYIEKWSMNPDKTGFAYYTIKKIPTYDLYDAFININVYVYTANKNIDRGVVEVRVLQNSKYCNFDIPLEWDLINVPLFALNTKPLEVKGTLIFNLP